MSEIENPDGGPGVTEPKPRKSRSRLRQKDPDAKVRYLVQQQGGDFIIEIPASWKVTFGAVNPGSGEVGHRGSLHCMRVYEGEKVRAVYCDVKGFRDTSIAMARQVKSEMRQSRWEQDSEGNFKGSRERKMTTGPLLVEGDFDGDAPDFDEDGELAF